MSLIVAVNGTYQSYFNKDKPAVGKFPTGKASLQNSKQKQANKSYSERKDLPHPVHMHLYAEDIMTKTVKSIPAQTSAIAAWDIITKKRIHHLVVIENGQIVGIISDRDLLPLIHDEKKQQTNVSEFMQREVILCQKRSELKLMARIMLDENISSLPVINDMYELVGIVTKTNVLESVVRHLPLEVWS